MRKRSMVLLIVMLMVSPLVMAGCSRDEVGIVRIQIQNMPNDISDGNKFFERVFNIFFPNAYAVAGWASNRTSLAIQLSSPDLVTVVTPIPLTTSELSMEIPAGPDRRICVYGYTTDGAVPRNWGGHADVTINPGDEKSITINMLPMTIISLSKSAGVLINWEAIGAAYGLLGYRIYRAENPDGPYSMVKQIANPATGSTSDAPQSGKTYYYKLCVYTATAEGEFTDVKSILY